MPNLSVRKLDAATYRRLKSRALQHHRSMEEEVRFIIVQAVNTSESIATIFTKNFGKTNGINLEIPNQRTPHDPIDFS